ncbi:MAG: hypothetical protein FJX74_19345 [Armatimonadetes bacterium]|nr:hypothetical protein [Armatimonadota bacterium]
MSVGRVLAVIILAAAILFPGVELIRFLFSDTLGLYQEMSLTDCLLFFVIVLLCALLLQRRTPEEPHLRAVGQKVEPPPTRPAERSRRSASRPAPEPSPPPRPDARPRPREGR